MTHDGMSTLCVIYQTLHPDYRKKDILQTLWQDHTSDFDIIDIALVKELFKYLHDFKRVSDRT